MSADRRGVKKGFAVGELGACFCDTSRKVRFFGGSASSTRYLLALGCLGHGKDTYVPYRTLGFDNLGSDCMTECFPPAWTNRDRFSRAPDLQHQSRTRSYSVSLHSTYIGRSVVSHLSAHLIPRECSRVASRAAKQRKVLLSQGLPTHRSDTYIHTLSPPSLGLFALVSAHLPHCTSSTKTPPKPGRSNPQPSLSPPIILSKRSRFYKAGNLLVILQVLYWLPPKRKEKQSTI